MPIQAFKEPVCPDISWGSLSKSWIKKHELQALLPLAVYMKQLDQEGSSRTTFELKLEILGGLIYLDA